MRGQNPQLARIMEQTLVGAWAVAFGVLFVILLRRGLLSMPVLATIAPMPRPLDTGEEDEQQPETDRAPRSFPWLPAAVALTGALRLCLLVGWHQ